MFAAEPLVEQQTHLRVPGWQQHGQSLETLGTSLICYEGAAPLSIEQEIYRNAIVKSYELAQETSFKLLKKALRDYGHSAGNLDATPAKELLRLSAKHGLMTLAQVEQWFKDRDNRNSTAHDYGEHFAKETLPLIPGFVTDAANLDAILRARFGGEKD